MRNFVREIEGLRQSVDAMHSRFQSLRPDAMHSIVRHSVDNLLNGSEMGIRTANRLLEKRTPADVPDCLNRVKASLERVDSLLANPHLRKPHEVVDARAFFSNALDSVRGSTDLQGVPVSLELHPSLNGSGIEICQDGVRESLRVFVDNAVHAMQTACRTKPITVHVEKNNGHVVVRVVDRGNGVPVEHRPNLFSNKFSTKGAKGHGIGLLGVKDVIEHLHDGTVFYEPRKRGSVFGFRLPVAKASG